MSAPWFDTWPTTWPDFVTKYRKMIPRAWGRGLFKMDGDGWKMLLATGEALSLAREAIEWMLQRTLPDNDSTGMFLDRWEAAFRIAPADTIASRQDRLMATMRQSGQPISEDAVRSMMVRAWGETDPDEVLLASSTGAQRAAADTLYASGNVTTYSREGTSMHIYKRNEDAHPDYSIANDIIAAIQPAGNTWSVGRYLDMICDLGACDSAVAS